MPSFTRALNLILALTLTLSALGCAAKDKHVFVSTVNQPTSLTLLDTYSNQAAWEMDIPVNHKLVLDFGGSTSGRSSDGTAPSWVNWKLYRADDLPTDTGRARKGKLVSSDRVDLTGKKVLIEVSYRPAPETPGSADAAPVPVQETPRSVAAEAIAESKAQADDNEVTQATEEAAEEATEQTADEVSEQDAGEEAQEAVQDTAEDTQEAADQVQEATEDAADEDNAAEPTK